MFHDLLPVAPNLWDSTHLTAKGQREYFQDAEQWKHRQEHANDASKMTPAKGLLTSACHFISLLFLLAALLILNLSTLSQVPHTSSLCNLWRAGICAWCRMERGNFPTWQSSVKSRGTVCPTQQQDLSTHYCLCLPPKSVAIYRDSTFPQQYPLLGKGLLLLPVKEVPTEKPGNSMGQLALYI